MNLQFILIQLIGIIAWLTLMLSYYKENTNKILLLQIIATILYCIHYYLLGAYNGAIICLLVAIIDYGYYKTNLDRYIFIISIPILIISGLYNYHTPLDLLPIISSIIDGYSLTKHKKIIIVGATISYTLWVIYDISVMSYSGAITDGLLALSNLSILLFHKNPLNKENNLPKKINISKNNFWGILNYMLY